MIGQERILRELMFLIPEIQGGRNFNILFLGPSGSGKTTMVWYILYHVNYQDVWYYLPEKGEINFREDRKYHFIDEIHLMDNFEFLYPLMDSGNYTFLFATNEFGNIPEPFYRRCLSFVLEPYTDDDMFEITRQSLSKLKVLLPENLVRKISSLCKNSPGIVESITKRLSYIFHNSKLPESEDELNDILENVLDIKDGLTNLDRRYLSALETLGRASLDRISSYSRIPKQVIIRDIEPYLLDKSLISIGSRGRQLI